MARQAAASCHRAIGDAHKLIEDINEQAKQIHKAKHEMFTANSLAESRTYPEVVAAISTVKPTGGTAAWENPSMAAFGQRNAARATPKHATQDLSCPPLRTINLKPVEGVAFGEIKKKLNQEDKAEGGNRRRPERSTETMKARLVIDSQIEHVPHLALVIAMYWKADQIDDHIQIRLPLDARSISTNEVTFRKIISAEPGPDGLDPAKYPGISLENMTADIENGSTWEVELLVNGGGIHGADNLYIDDFHFGPFQETVRNVRNITYHQCKISLLIACADDLDQYAAVDVRAVREAVTQDPLDRWNSPNGADRTFQRGFTRTPEDRPKYTLYARPTLSSEKELAIDAGFGALQEAATLCASSPALGKGAEATGRCSEGRRRRYCAAAVRQHDIWHQA